jgi:HK97 family phage major capsid protein
VELQQKLEGIESALQSFISEQKSRLLGIEQKVVGMRGGPGESAGLGSAIETKAPVDSLGRAWLGPEHKMVHNLPALPNGEARKKLDFSKWLRGVVTGHWDGAADERKSLTETSAAGVLVPELLAAEWIDIARAQTRCIEAGARSVPVTGGSAKIPQLTSDVQAAWQAGELATIATTNPTIGSRTVTPHTLAAYIPSVSIQLFEDSDLIGVMLMNAFARAFAVQLDAAALTGQGGNGPLGLLYDPAVQQLPIGGVKITGDQISKAISYVKGRNYIPGAYILGPEAEADLDQAKASTAGMYLGLPEGVSELQELVTSSAGLNCFVGDFSKLVFFPRTEITLETSRVGDGTAWSTLAVSLRAYLRCDVQAVEPGAFEVLYGLGS